MKFPETREGDKKIKREERVRGRRERERERERGERKRESEGPTPHKAGTHALCRIREGEREGGRGRE